VKAESGEIISDSAEGYSHKGYSHKGYSHKGYAIRIGRGTKSCC
jgi:uncharacterized protein YegP (UPF0339 family)